MFAEMCPSGEDWQQTALLAWAAIAPHSRNPPRIIDFLPPGMRSEQILSRAMTPDQIRGVLKGNR